MQSEEIKPSVLATAIREALEAKERRERWEWVEASIWTDRMLAALENGVRGGKWYSLMDKVVKHQTLHTAWEKVKANKGAAGVDRISIDRFKAQKDKYLGELAEELRAGTYRPESVWRVYIPKAGGKNQKRPLGIPAVKDRIVQMAIKMVIEPIFEQEFQNTSYGFRPGRGCKNALRQVDKKLKEGHVWVVDADFKSYFDTIPHDRIMMRVAERIADKRLLMLIKSFLKANIMDGLEQWTPTQGTPQGGVISPLLANLYLHDMDCTLAKTGVESVRYADDFVMLCTTQEQAEQAFSLVKQWVTENGLTLHPDKTHIGDCRQPGEGFVFLGYRFEAGRKWVRGKSLKALKDKIRARTKRTRGSAMKEIIKGVNPTLEGWFEYFKHASKWTFPAIDGFVRRRLRAIHRKQENRPGFGRTYEDHRRWPNSYFAGLGLFTMKEAHALASQSR